MGVPPPTNRNHPQTGGFVHRGNGGGSATGGLHDAHRRAVVSPQAELGSSAEPAARTCLTIHETSIDSCPPTNIYRSNDD